MKIFRDTVNKVQTWKHESQNSQEDIKEEEEEQKGEEQEKPQNDQKVLKEYGICNTLNKLNLGISFINF